MTVISTAKYVIILTVCDQKINMILGKVIEFSVVSFWWLTNLQDRDNKLFASVLIAVLDAYNFDNKSVKFVTANLT